MNEYLKEREKKNVFCMIIFKLWLPPVSTSDIENQNDSHIKQIKKAGSGMYRYICPILFI